MAALRREMCTAGQCVAARRHSVANLVVFDQPMPCRTGREWPEWLAVVQHRRRRDPSRVAWVVDVRDFLPTKAPSTLCQLRTIGNQINERLLDTERLSHACSLKPSRFERLQQPIVLGDRRVSALRFGDPGVHALLQAISRFSLVPEGFQNRDVRPLVAALLGRELDAYSRAAMTYDLRCLRVHGLIERVPHSHRYIVTLDGMQIAAFNNTLYHHVLSPGWAVLAQRDLDTPAPLDRAIRHLATVTSDLFDQVHSNREPSAVAA